MQRSIAVRLAIMFGVAAFVVFSVVGLALYRVLQEQLDRHQVEQLSSRFTEMEYMIVHGTSPELWSKVRAKLDALTPPSGRVKFWIASDDPRFEYGDDPASVARDTRNRHGIAEVKVEGREHPMKIQSSDIAASGVHPAVRFMVGADTGPYIHTMRAFEIALASLTLAGILLATTLSYWIARVGLKPLNRLSEEAQKISPRTLSQRLAFAPLPKELAALSESFNGALSRLDTAYHQLEVFNADVAHELRTPLANLIGQTQVALARERTAAHLEEVLQSNLEELERLRAIVNDMLFLARADQGERAMRLVQSSVASEVEKTVDFLDFILDESGMKVRIKGDAIANIETSLFRRALTNLLQNAIQHSQSGSEILVDVTVREQSSVTISISNPSEPISPEHLDRLFDRFYRVDSSRRNSWENHGLGLSIVKAVAEMHQGTVFATHRDGWTTVGFSVSGTVATGQPKELVAA